MAVPTLYLSDRWDERLGVLPALGSMRYSEELGGEDTIEFLALMVPEKGDRLVWRDPESGAWREHEVVRTDEGTAGACHVYAESSLCELLYDYVVWGRLRECVGMLGDDGFRFGERASRFVDEW